MYKKFIDFMDDEIEGEVINEWKALPYDWRLDIDQVLSSGKVIGGTAENPQVSYTEATSSPYIFQELERLVQTSENGKVTLVTHSNGGLLAKYLLDEIANVNHPYHHLYTKIDKLVMVAVPQIGTPKAVEGLLHGNSTQLGVKEWGFIMDEAQSRELAENMQSAYNLLPSKKYFDIVQSPVVEFDPDVSSIYYFPSLYGTAINTVEKLYSFLRGDYEASIPNSYYEERGEVKYAGVSGATTTDVVLKGEDLGTFTFIMEETFNDQIIAQM